MAYDNNNIFAKILRGEIPSVKVYEDDKTLAFMDVMPEAKGHVLAVPKENAEDILDLSADGLAAMMATVQKLARAVDKALSPDGILLKQYNRAPAGQTIFHVHFHIVPRFQGDPLTPHAKAMVDPKDSRTYRRKDQERTMIIERAIFALKPGTKKADFIAAFALARPHIEGAKGFRKLEMRQGTENPDSWLLLVWWDTVDDHMKGFRQSPAFAEWRKHLGPFFAAPPSVEHYEETL